jgi:hypothetical protein
VLRTTEDLATLRRFTGLQNADASRLRLRQEGLRGPHDEDVVDRSECEWGGPLCRIGRITAEGE